MNLSVILLRETWAFFAQKFKAEFAATQNISPAAAPRAPR
jgi:hypothetical protein